MFGYFQNARKCSQPFHQGAWISQEVGHFHLKTAESRAEMKMVLKELRGHSAIDDRISPDLLFILEKRSGRVRGACSLNRPQKTADFFLADRFDLKNLNGEIGSILEAGPIWWDKRLSGGILSSLLWKGILEFMFKTHCHWLLGSFSVPLQSPWKLISIQRNLEKRARVCDADRFAPLTNCRMRELAFWKKIIKEDIADGSTQELETLLETNPVFEGSCLHIEPALNRKVGTVDFLYLTQREHLPILDRTPPKSLPREVCMECRWRFCRDSAGKSPISGVFSSQRI